MSGQDYVYIVWATRRIHVSGGYLPENYIVGTAPTKYQARQLIDRQPPNSATYRIQRWRHGDTEGHWCD